MRYSTVIGRITARTCCIINPIKFIQSKRIIGIIITKIKRKSISSRNHRRILQRCQNVSLILFRLFREVFLGRSAADGVVNTLVDASSIELSHQSRVERNVRVHAVCQYYGFRSRQTQSEKALVVSQGGFVVFVVPQGATHEPFFFKLLLDHRFSDVHAGIGVQPHETAEGEEPDSVDHDGPRIQHMVRRDGAAREL